MSVHFSLSSPSSSSTPHPTPPGARLIALKAQIRKRNATLSSSRPPLTRRRSLLTLHQQAMELMSPESFDPFIDAPPSSPPSPRKGHRKEPSHRGEEKEALRPPHSRQPSTSIHTRTSPSMHSTPSPPPNHPAIPPPSSLLRPSPPLAPDEPAPLKLSKRQMRALLAGLSTSHPALVAHSGCEDKEPPPLPPPTLAPPSLCLSTLSSFPPSSSPSNSTSSPLPPPPSHQPPHTHPPPTLPPPPPPLTPRLSFSSKRVQRFDDSVKVMMSFSHADMESIRTEILKRGGGVSRAQFLAIAVKKRGGEEGYEREVEALAEMFDEIDVNGDGDLQYSEFTSYLVELANGRYDHHHIDQLLHTRYHHTEPAHNDDRIDVTLIRWLEPIAHFILFEKGQHRFKVLDAQKKTVKVVRGHGGECIDCEWLPLHGVLLTSSADRTLRFWSVDDRVRTKEGKEVTKAAEPSRAAPLSRLPLTSTPSPSFPTFTCLSVWSLPSPQVCLCWTKGRLYSADILGRLLVWNIDVGEIRTSVQAHEGRVTLLMAVTEEGALVSGGMDGRVRLWDCQDMKCVGEWKHEGAVRALSWDAGRREVISGGDDDAVLVWDVRRKEVVRSMNFREVEGGEGGKGTGRGKKGGGAGLSRRKGAGQVQEDGSVVESGDSVLGLSVTKEEVLVLSQYGVIRVVSVAKWAVEQLLILPRVWEEQGGRGDEEEETDSDDERLGDDVKEALSLRARDLVSSWTVIRSQPLSPPLPIAFASTPSPPPENVFVVSAGASLYSFTRHSAVNHFIADSHPILQAVYNASGFSVLTASHRSLKVWDCITGRLLKEFHDIVPRGCLISSMCLDGRGRKAIVGGSDGRVAIFNLNSGSEMQRLDRHEGEVINLCYIEEAVNHQQEGEGQAGREGGGKEGGDDPLSSSASPDADGAGCHKLLCSSRNGVYIHLDDHEADVSASSYTSLYHASFDHHSDITALASSAPFRIIASASADSSIIFYPANLDGTPLQKLHIPSPVTVLLFLHPYRLLLVGAGQGCVHVYAFSNEQHQLIGEFTNTTPAGDPCNVVCVAFDARTETLYTGDEGGWAKGWPLRLHLFDPFRALLAAQGLDASSPHLPDAAAVRGSFPRGLEGVAAGLVIAAHKGVVTSVVVMEGREGRWSAAVMAEAAAREAKVEREAEEWKETMKEAEENAVYRTAQLLYEGATVDPAHPLPPPPTASASTRRPSTTFSDFTKPSSSSLSMAELLSLLSPVHLAQLTKERKRIHRQLQLDFDHHFAALRSHHTALHNEAMHALDVGYGSPTAVMSSGMDGCVKVWSTEGGGECLGSLQQGEVATLGRGTPAGWRFYVNIEQRKAWEAERLVEFVREMEEERARWKEGEERRKEEEAVARQLREEEMATREEEDDPNDALPFTRASTKEQRKMLDRAEQDSTAIIHSTHFQHQLHPPPPPTTAKGALPPLATTSPGRGLAAVRGLLGGSGGVGVALPSLAPVKEQRRASLELDAEYFRPGGRQPAVRANAGGMVEERQGVEVPALQLSRYQRMKAEVAKAIPLTRREEESEEAEVEEKAGEEEKVQPAKRDGKRMSVAQQYAVQAVQSMLGPSRQKKQLARNIALSMADKQAK